MKTIFIVLLLLLLSSLIFGSDLIRILSLILFTSPLYIIGMMLLTEDKEK